MNQLQQQILYTNNGETEQESRIAKAKLRKELHNSVFLKHIPFIRKFFER